MILGLYILGGSETFQDKVNFFQRELRQVHMKKPHSKISLKVSRPNLLDSVSMSNVEVLENTYSREGITTIYNLKYITI